MNLLHLATPKYATLPSAIVISNKTIKVILVMDVQTCPRCNDSVFKFTVISSTGI